MYKKKPKILLVFKNNYYRKTLYQITKNISKYNILL